MSASIAWALVFGTCIGLGLWSLASVTPPFRSPRLAERLAPYILDVSSHARELVRRRTTDPLPLVGLLLSPAVGRARRALEAVLGGGTTIEARLDRSRSPLSLEQFRLQQILWGCAGVVFGIVTPTLVPSLGSMPVVALVAFPVFCAMAGVVVRDKLLQQRAAARVGRLVGELPTVLEFLTLSLSAGEGIHDAIRRVSRISQGELAGEFALVLTEVGLGSSLADALIAMDDRLACPPLSRFVEQTTAALERGSPLSEVLRAQADDARAAHRRRLLDTAGRKEVAMMIPLVFLILPMTICFAIFPEIVVLQTQF